MSDKKFPPGWDADRVKAVIGHYDAIGEEDLTAEDEAGQPEAKEAVIRVPVELLPVIRELIAKHKSA